MFLQPIFFFTAVLWLLAFMAIGLYVLFRRAPATAPISTHDRLVSFAALALVGILGAGAVVGLSVLLSEVL